MYHDRVPITRIDLGAVGAQQSSHEDLQVGARRLENARTDFHGAIAKREGYTAIGLQRSATPDDDIPAAEVRAIWARDVEVVVETATEIYGRARLVEGEWRLAGPWSRYLYREAVIYQHSPATVEVDEGDCCEIQLAGETGIWQAADGGSAGIFVQLLGERIEASALLGGGELRPRIVRHGAGECLLAYERATGLLYRYLTDEVGSEVATGMAVTGDRAWSVHGEFLASGEGISVWTRSPAIDTLRIVGLPRTGAGLMTVDSGAITGADVGQFYDTATWILPGGTATQVDVVWAACGWRPSTSQPYVLAGHSRLNFTTGAYTQVWRNDINVTADPLVCAVYTPDLGTTVEVVVEVSDVGVMTTPNVESYQLTSGSAAALGDTFEAMALVSSSESYGGIGAAWLCRVADDPLARSGYFLHAPSTGEILARSGVGVSQGEQAFSDYRNSTTNPGIESGSRTIALRTRQRASEDVVTQQRIVRLLPTAANNPAVFDDVAVSAHAGYPRAYAGGAPFEHDWHELPEFTAAVNGAGGYGPGVVSVAATWEWTDETGQLYRSGPTFQEVTLAASDSIDVNWKKLELTERSGVAIAFWRTLSGDQSSGKTYYRAAFGAASISGSANLSLDDTQIRDEEQLDQAPGTTGIQFSVPASITDWVGVAGGRLWSRDTRRSDVARYTIPQRGEGLALHWADQNLFDHVDGDPLVGIANFDGRTVLIGERFCSQTSGLGPDATGRGAFPPSNAIPASERALGQHAIVQTPGATVLATDRGLWALDRGLVLSKISDALERRYEIDGVQILAVGYESERQALHVLDTAGWMELDLPTGRWVEHPQLDGLDIVVRRGVDVFWVASTGDAMERTPGAYLDGPGTPAARSMLIELPIQRGAGQGGPSYPGFKIHEVAVVGQYEGAHDLRFEISIGTEVVDVVLPAVRITAANAAGDPYAHICRLPGLYGTHAVIRVSDNDPAGASARWAAVEVYWEPAGKPDKPAQLGDDHVIVP